METALSPQQPLVVLDLNGCLAHLDYDGKELGKETADFCVRRKFIRARPFLHTLLAELFSNYRVGVWTCNGPAYAVPIAKRLFGSYYGELAFVWTQEHCTMVPNKAGKVVLNKESLMLKDMDRLVVAGLVEDARDAVLVDDTPEKKAGKLGSGLVLVKPYVPSLDKTATVDAELLILKSKLDLWRDSRHHHVRL